MTALAGAPVTEQTGLHELLGTVLLCTPVAPIVALAVLRLDPCPGPLDGLPEAR